MEWREEESWHGIDPSRPDPSRPTKTTKNQEQKHGTKNVAWLFERRLSALLRLLDEMNTLRNDAVLLNRFQSIETQLIESSSPKPRPSQLEPTFPKFVNNAVQKSAQGPQLSAEEAEYQSIQLPSRWIDH